MAGEGNVRTFDPEIAEVVLQAILDGHHTYRQAVAVVHDQAPLRAAEVEKAGGRKSEVDAERRRWDNFGPGTITKWKMANPEFERELMAAQDYVALEDIEDIRKIGLEAVAIASNQKLDCRERQTQILGLRCHLNAETWVIKMRLEIRKTYHESTPKGQGLQFPTMPANRRFEGAAPAVHGDARPN